MTKPVEIYTPSLPEFCEDIAKYAKEGYRIHVSPQLLGWQYYCEMVPENDPEVVVTEAPKRGPKPKAKAEAVKELVEA